MKDRYCQGCVEEENTKRDLEKHSAEEKLNDKKISSSTNKRKPAAQVLNERDSKKPK